MFCIILDNPAQDKMFLYSIHKQLFAWGPWGRTILTILLFCRPIAHSFWSIDFKNFLKLAGVTFVLSPHHQYGLTPMV